MNILAIKARSDAAKVWSGNVAPYSTGSGVDPWREMLDHAPADLDDLLAVLDPLLPYLHHDMPVEDLAGAVKLIRENHERYPLVCEDWSRERQDREFYEGLLAECARALGPLAESDPALRELAGRLQMVLVAEDEEGPIIGG